MSLNASGNLGLGVTPSAWGSSYKAVQLGVLGIAGISIVGNDASIGTNYYFNSSNNITYATTGAISYLSMYDGQFRFYNAPSGTAGTTATITQTMTLDASGNLLVGTTSNASGRRFLAASSLPSGGYPFEFQNTASSSPFGLVISYSGAAPNNTSSSFLYLGDNTALRLEVRSNGGIANFQANDANLSDRREKTNFAPAKSYLDVICAIPVQTFNYIDQSEDDPGLTLGVVAQDVQAVAPELVSESNWGTADDPKMRLSIYQTDLQYALMKCIQEQQALIQSLTDRITQLEAK
jgi:hypothetical protein